MRNVFEDREIEPPIRAAEPETEFVLGSTGVMLVLVAIVAICATCFGLGYAAGHRAPVAAAAQPQLTNPDLPLVANASRQKPAATSQAPAAPPDENASAGAPPAADPDGDIVGAPAQPQAQAAAQPAAPANGGWAVKPALPNQPVQSSSGGSTLATAPAMAVPQDVVVQIAAVSHEEDASVLMNALRRRGYAVSAHRDLADNLIHVQVGPFGNRNDAIAMRNKLLGDGYNAVIEP